MSKIISKQIDSGDTIVLYRIRRKSDGYYRCKRGWGGYEQGSTFASTGHARNHMRQCGGRRSEDLKESLAQHELVKLTFRKESEEVMPF